MFTRASQPQCCYLIVLLAAATTTVGHVFAQDVIHVYGSEGPSPAVNEAAQAFGGKYKLTVEVVSGPADKWIDQAKTDADVVFCSAEFMMSDLIGAGELQIDSSSVTPLYLRPSAILVRPGNPKAVRDFPDLLRPGMRLMVVTGSGQTGLWEDMAGKQGDIQTIRDFRKNVVLFAPNSEAAQKAWKEREDLDAWVTWNIWHLPLREHADLVPVSNDYVVYRQCSVALTERGREKASARQFVEFLASPEGAAIFKSWEWLTSPEEAKTPPAPKNVAVVCRIDKDESRDGVGAGLGGVRRLVEGYRSAGVSQDHLVIVAVVHGEAAYWVLKDGPYRVFTKREGENPNKATVKEVLEMGVRVEVCAQAMQEHGWTKDDVLPGVQIVPDAYPRIADLQLQGYAYLRF